MSIRHSLFLSHGGGPLPLLDDPQHSQLVSQLQHIASQLPKPDAIIVCSAHWEADPIQINAAAAPELLYDYSGFPAAAYQLAYPCPGQPALADAVTAALHEHDINAEQTTQRGLDHGVFVPLSLMFPDASIPCVQVSLHPSLSADQHLKLGHALASIEWPKMLLIGSGFSFHNMQAFFSSAETDDKNLAFEAWLQHTVQRTDISEQQRAEQLCHWQQAPHAHYCHPRAEHLLPLHVCYGALGRPAQQAWSAHVLNKQASFFLW